MHSHNALATSGRLRDLVRVSRPAGALVRLSMNASAVRWFQREYLRDGVHLREMLCFLVRRTLFEPPAADGTAQLDFFSPERLSPGFLTWARQARLTPAFFPLYRDSCLLRLIRSLYDMGDGLDPNLVTCLGPPRHWYLFHTAAFVDPELGLAVLRNPGAALAAAERYFPAHVIEEWRRHEWVTQLLYQIRDTAWIQGRSLGRYSFRRQCDESRRYHDALARRRDEALLKRAQLDTKPFPEPGFTEFADEDYRLVWLPDPPALVEESVQMGNCVAGYAEMCRLALAIIYSVRSTAGKRLATLELDPKNNIAQLMGPWNTRPDRKVARWVRQTVRTLAARPGLAERSYENVLAHYGAT